MAVSGLATILRANMRQTCTVYRYAGAAEDGQPIYGAPVRWPCRIAIKTRRVLSQDGDWITNSAVVVALPAECEIGAYDRIDLPAGYEQGAVVGEVITGTDQWGNVTHRSARIA